MRYLILIFITSLLFAKVIEVPKRIQDTNYKYVVSGGVIDGMKVYTAYIANSGTPTVSSQSGYWISSVTDVGTGDFTIVVPSGIFSSAPNCTCTVMNNGDATCQSAVAITATAVRYRTRSDSDQADHPAYIICIGE